MALLPCGPCGPLATGVLGLRRPIPRTRVLHVFLHCQDGDNLSLNASSMEGREMLTLCDRVLCNLGGKLRMKSMEGERARQLKASSTYLEILLREDAKAYAKSRYYLRRESFRVPNILIILDAEGWDYFQYVGFVILYHPITGCGTKLSGGCFEGFLEGCLEIFGPSGVG